MKPKSLYLCEHCQARFHQWQGQCPKCGTWGSLKPVQDQSQISLISAGKQAKKPCLLQDLPQEEQQSVSTGSDPVDSLFGQGLIPGSVVLLAGEPGVGKSTFLLQLTSAMAAKGKKAVYVSGEEALSQLKISAERMGILSKGIQAMSTTRVEDICGLFQEEPPPELLVVDSIQTLTSENSDGLAGSVTQVKSTASSLLETVKNSRTTLILVGHVTKEGQIAGPKLLEHMVDTVMYLEGDKQHFHRILRVHKNRFGPTSNVLVMQMTSKGLQIIFDPSTFFLQARDASLSGTALHMALEGQRAFAVEIQALVSKSFLTMPRRTALGFDTNRLHLLLAIMEKRLKLNFAQTDIYAKIGGGLKLEDPSMDLALAASILSSFYDRPLSSKAVFWGEMDLNGQVRPVNGEEIRINQANQLGYAPIVCPLSSRVKKQENITPASSISDLQKILFGPQNNRR